jgi:hypothetical protein
MKQTTKSAGGTSFHDITIQATVKELREALGTPMDANNSGQDKVNFEWVAETETGSVFTVYDWKEYRSLREDELVDWHIGAHNKQISIQAKYEIGMALPITQED